MYGAAEEDIVDVLKVRGGATCPEGRKVGAWVSAVVVGGVRVRRVQWLALVRNDREKVLPMIDIANWESVEKGLTYGYDC